ncbi:MAG: 23S rRNA (guanosine(2251)-2'-O)-methyltransferase RlmB [Acidobacteriota bacterium]
MKHQHKPDTSLWISGINPAREALVSTHVTVEEMVIARSDQRIDELVELARKRGIPVRKETKENLSVIVGHTHHQGVGLRAPEYPYTDLDALLKLPMHEREPLFILDSIQDPQNLGAMLRSGGFLGAKGILIPKDRSVRVTATVIKIAAGATAYVPVVQVVNLTRALEQLKESGLWIAGLDVEGSIPVYNADLTIPTGLVVGNEQKGLRPLVRKHCDLLVSIPSNGPIQSLNAASAGTVVLAELQRQRLAKGL